MILTTKVSTDSNGNSYILVYCGSATRPRRYACESRSHANAQQDTIALEHAIALEHEHAGDRPELERTCTGQESYELPDACNHSRVHIMHFAEP